MKLSVAHVAITTQIVTVTQVLVFCIKTAGCVTGTQADVEEGALIQGCPTEYRHIHRLIHQFRDVVVFGLA